MKLINYIKLMLQDRGGTPNTKLHYGSLLAIVMIIGLLVSVDSAVYQTFTFATLCFRMVAKIVAYFARFSYGGEKGIISTAFYTDGNNIIAVSS